MKWLVAAQVVVALALLWWPVSVRSGRGKQARWFSAPKGGYVLKKEVNPTLVVGEVAARMRAGTPSATAWQETLKRQGLLENSRCPASAVEALRQVPAYFHQGLQVPALIAGVKFTEHLGAGASEVLQGIAEGISVDATLNQERKVAIAAPVVSARILMFLPVVALFGMWLSGIITPAWFFTNPAGIAVGTVGLGLLTAGIWWMHRLISKAASPCGQ